MNASTAARVMLATAGMTQEKAAAVLGKNGRQGFNDKLKRGSITAAELAKLAAACGYRLQLVAQDGSVIEIGG